MSFLSKSLLLSFFSVLSFSFSIYATPESFLGESDVDHFYLREISGGFTPYTYIDVLNAKKEKIGYYQNSLFSWNNDLYLFDALGGEQLRTDIKTFLQLRKQEYIYDVSNRVIARVEQELLNKIGNNLVKDALHVASPYRRYNIYDEPGNLQGVTRKIETTNTVIEFLDATETKIVARAEKTLGAKLSSVAWGNPEWHIQILDKQHPAANPQVIATVIAIKARADIAEASSTRWKVINTVLEMVLPKHVDDKDPKNKKEI